MVSANLFQRAREVFDVVRAAPEAGRTALIDLHCANDGALRAEVQSLLAAHGNAGDRFLEPPTVVGAARFDATFPSAGQAAGNPSESSAGRPSPIPPPLAPAAWAESLVGRRIGQFTLLRLLAMGGMGCVFEARQDHPSRAVALKVLRPGLSGTSALARFRLEPQVLARLDHPNIAHVYEAGVLDDATGAVPWFAMELVAGALTLSEYVTTRDLPLRARLELMAKVCDAVHHGHQKGVIHRDLKPANILVAREEGPKPGATASPTSLRPSLPPSLPAEPKIIDFGIARATDADLMLTTQQTHVGDLIGTIRYMSPEQCDGDPAKIDTRTDVYSLGVVLYELLVGVPPYQTSGTTMQAAIRNVTQQPPTRPSDVNRALRGDLDAILLKALEKTPARRYDSAAALADDIRRHLRREPIEARPPGLAVRLARWAARRPVLATTAASVVIAAVSLLGTIGAIAWYALMPYDLAKIPQDRNPEDTKRVELRSIGRTVLRAWTGPPGTAIADSYLVDDPAGGKLAVLCGHWNADDNLRGSLVAFPVAFGFGAPPHKWKRFVETDEVLPRLRKLRDFVGEEFSAEHAFVEDIFPDAVNPGVEVLVVFANKASQRSVRLYDLDGDVLWEFWHDGGIGRAYWMKDVGLLAFAGENQEAFWTPDGKSSLEQTRAEVAFAVKPVMGKILRDRYLPLERTGNALADLFVPAWYVTPVIAGKIDTRWRIPNVSRPLRVANQRDCVEIWIGRKELDKNPGMNITLDATGIERARHAGDSWQSAMAAQREGKLPYGERLPAPEDFELRPFIEVYPQALAQQALHRGEPK